MMLNPKVDYKFPTTTEKSTLLDFLRFRLYACPQHSFGVSRMANRIILEIVPANLQLGGTRSLLNEVGKL